MMCQAIHSWTFTQLVGAFLDLSIAYLLLCASSIAFFISKFLGVFGLCLPCPCDGLFGNPRNNFCLQRQLVDCSFEKISSVQSSAKSKFPFDSIWHECHGGTSNVGLVREGTHENKHVELEGGASSSSYLEKRPHDLTGRDSVAGNEVDIGFGAENSAAEKEGKLDFKGKGIESWRLRHGLRRRRKGIAASYGKRMSFPSYDTVQSDTHDIPQSPSSISKVGNKFTELPANYGDGEEARADVSLQEGISQCHQLNGSMDENKPIETDALPIGGFRCNEQENLGIDNNEKTSIRVLEQALEEGYAARDALYLELEKERSAAASAADEAMAMILRLQEEKASIEMEARQYQRMIEEKYAYDAEEMGILKEILVRREREKHFLEKEVEAYRQMIFGYDELDSDMHDVGALQAQMTTSSFLSEEPILMLQQISESVEKPKLKITNSYSDNEVSSIESQSTLAFGEKLPILELDENSDTSKRGDMRGDPSIGSHLHFSSTNEVTYEFQEKSVISMDDNPICDKKVQRREAGPKWSQSAISEGLALHEITTPPIVKEHDQTGSTSLFLGFESKTSGSCNERGKIIRHNGDNMHEHGNDQDQVSKNLPSLVLDTESCVYDVHVIDDEKLLCGVMTLERNEQLLESTTLNLPIKCDSPTLSRMETEHEKNGSSSGITGGLPPKGSSRGKALPTDLRRHSMSAIDYERVRIDNEVEWLRERLKLVQEGREKLNFSMEHKERGKIQLQLLEDIASQLREIQQLTEPGKAVRQASLPPPSSQVMSKKRRWRSASLGVHRST
ncbi:hypothetical protein FNV43_RR02340 [Rhamnella rubrinervis]|uniref:GTD-binding domain-containing protein n=1 Tax=Rhamnella rubrinervis TaxID=2594499 RepID=A0A8K0HRA5_9ROSA|nr:hypothetical protein FNV43_RR02340 [Rhamnella rubrinervis]